MKATDLMIGDWVYTHEPEGSIIPEGKAHRIFEIWGISDEVTADDSWYPIDDIRPIPLTEDILVKNGWDFSKRKYGVYCKEDKFHDVELSRDDYGFYWSINTDEYELLRVDYVHQLQHLLRLCDVQKEIEL